MSHPDSIENKKLSDKQLKDLNNLLALPPVDAHKKVTALPNSSLIDFSTDFPNDSSETRELKTRFRQLCQAEALQPYWQERLSELELKPLHKTFSAYHLLVGTQISFTAFEFLAKKEFKLFLQWSDIGLKQYQSFDTYANLIAFFITHLYQAPPKERQNFGNLLEKLRLEMLAYYSGSERCQAVNLTLLGHFAKLNLFDHQPMKAFLSLVEMQEALQKIEHRTCAAATPSTDTSDAQAASATFSLQKFKTYLSIFWNRQTAEEVKKDFQKIAETAAREAIKAPLCRSA
jgi:hypothetical protein